MRYHLLGIINAHPIIAVTALIALVAACALVICLAQPIKRG